LGASDTDPLSYAVPAAAGARKWADLSRLRVGYTEDFGVCEVDSGIRAVFRERVAALKHNFALCEPLDFDFADAHRCFDVLRAEAFVAGLQEAYESDPNSLGPNPRANYEMGMRLSLTDCVWAHAAQTRLFRDFQRLFDRYDVILAPTTPVSPFPWREPYAASINGVALDHYYRWLALTYVVTLVTLGPPHWSAGRAVTLIAALLVGTAVGAGTAGRVSARAARAATLLLAAAGGLAVVVAAIVG